MLISYGFISAELKASLIPVIDRSTLFTGVHAFTHPSRSTLVGLFPRLAYRRGWKYNRLAKKSDWTNFPKHAISPTKKASVGQKEWLDKFPQPSHIANRD